MSEMNFQQARHNMIEQQLRTWNILDTRVLDVVDTLARDQFVPEGYQNLAYADIQIPLGHGQKMLTPMMEAKILQVLDIQADEHIMEVGTGSGYTTACMAALGKQVTSIEIHPEILTQAQKNLAAAGITNITLQAADLASCSLSKGMFDAIAITGSIPFYNNELRENLNIGGRLFVVTGEEPRMEAKLITRSSENSWDEQVLFETNIPGLVGFEPRKDFTL